MKTIVCGVRRGSPPWFRLTALAACALLASCAQLVEGKVLVPGTNQRLLVGQDGWPNASIWVEEDGVIRPVQIKWEAAR